MLEVVPPLQLAIGPVILISGLGLILLSVTNRFGRVIDRSRLLARELREGRDTDGPRILQELRILARGALLHLDVAPLIVAIFAACMLSLITCLLLFISDINLSLHALWLEIPPNART